MKKKQCDMESKHDMMYTAVLTTRTFECKEIESKDAKKQKVISN